MGPRDWIVVLATTSLAITATTCVYAPRRSLRPREQPLRQSKSIEGRYCFTTVALSMKHYPVHANERGWVQFLPLWEMKEYSLVDVRQSDDTQTLTFRYTDAAGKPKESVVRRPWRWEDDRMIIDIHHGNPFGFFRSRRGWVLYRLPGGRLTAIDTRSDTGLSCGLIPIYERQESVALLEPESACAR